MVVSWYSPLQEICYDGRLLEAGEIFSLRQHLRNEDVMRRVGQVVQTPRRFRSWRCDSCGKTFLLERYKKLHQINGCGRLKEEQIYYDSYEEDFHQHEYELALLKGWV